MKKIILITTILALCSACQSGNSDLEKYALNCKVAELTLQADTLEFPYTVRFNDRGKIETVTTRNHDGSFRFEESCIYDGKGRVIEILGVNDEQETEIRYEYDYDGSFVKECRVYGMNNQQMHRWVHENNGRHIVKSDYYGEGELIYTLKKTFSGDQYKEETLGPEGEQLGKATVYFYRTETRPTRIEGEGIDVEIEYNEKGLPVMSRNTVLNSRAELQWISDLEEHPSRYYQYEYDERGNWISRADRVHPDSTAYAVLRRTITYQK